MTSSEVLHVTYRTFYCYEEEGLVVDFLSMLVSAIVHLTILIFCFQGEPDENENEELVRK